MENTSANEAYIDRLSETFDHDTKAIVAGMTIIDLGRIIDSHDDGSVDVQCLGTLNGSFPIFKNVEVVFPFGIGMHHINDTCLILVPRTSFQSLDDGAMDTSQGFFSPEGAKIIPINTMSQLGISVGFDNIGNFVFNGNGVALTFAESYFEIAYGSNTYRYNNDGTTADISAGGLIDTGSEEGTLTYNIYDEDGNLLFAFSIDPTGKILLNVTESASRICEINIGNNSISVTDNDDDGKHIIVQDANRDPDSDDDHGNMIVINEDGIEITDKNENNVKMTEDGIDVTDANGNSFTMNSDGIVEQTNSSTLLEIGNQVATLGGLLQELAQDLISASTVGSPSAHTMDPGTQANLQSWMQKMQQVFS